MKQAVILAAGEGQRLRPFTVTKPKTMISIAGKPILQYVVEALAKNGIRDIVIVAGYRREQVFNYLGNGEKFGVNIRYITQEKQLGTAHALMQAKAVLDDEFIVLPGDNLIEANTIADFIKMKPQAMLVKKVANTTRYGVVTADSSIVRSIAEKPEEAERDIINTGIYSFNKRVFDYMNAELAIPDAINDMIADGQTICCQETDGTWLDVVYPWDILGLNNAILSRTPPNLGGTIETGTVIKGLVAIGKGTIIRANCYIMGPVVIGESCDIGPNVCILPATSIGNNVVISAFSTVENTVIGNDVNIGPNAIIEDSVIDESCLIQGRFTASSSEVETMVNAQLHTVTVGVMLGVGCKLKTNIVGQPGTTIGNYVQVQSGKVLSGNLPDKSIIY